MPELIEVIDDDFNVLKVVPRDEIIEKNLKHKSVVVILRNNKNKFFVTQRKSRRRLFPLKWDLGVTGFVREGESFEQAAARELKNELDVEASLQFLFDFDYKSDVQDLKAKVFLVFYDDEMVLNKDECQDGKWISLKELEYFIDSKLLSRDTAFIWDKYIESLT